MSRTYKKILIISILLVLALTGCKAAETQSPTEVEEEPTMAPEEPTAAPTTEPVEEEVTLRFMFPEGAGRGPGFEAAIAAYKDIKPNVTIETEIIPYNEYFDVLPVQFAGDDPADVVLIDSNNVVSYAYNEAISPLDDQFTEADIDDFLSSLVEQATYEGNMYAGPFFISTQGVFYNIDMFEAAGVEPPKTIEEAWTWPEYVEKVTQVVEHAENEGEKIWGVVYLNNPPHGTSWTLPVIRSNGEPGSPTFMALSPDGTQVSGYLDTPDAIEAYKFWQDLYLKYEFAPQADVPDAFPNEKAATMISFSAWGSVLDNVFPDLNWGVMPIPYFETPVVHASHFMPTVAAKSEYQEEAKNFVKFLTSKEGFLAYYSVTSDLPARTSLLKELEDLQEPPLSIFKEELLSIAYPAPGGRGGAIYSELFGDLMVDIAKGADIQSAVSSTVEELDRQLEQFK